MRIREVIAKQSTFIVMSAEADITGRKSCQATMKQSVLAKQTSLSEIGKYLWYFAVITGIIQISTEKIGFVFDEKGKLLRERECRVIFRRRGKKKRKWTTKTR